MRVNFLFNDGDTFDDFFELEVDWNYPVLPRLNEHLAPSFIMKLLTPKVFYEKLNDEHKKQWDDRRNEFKNELPREQVERETMCNRLIEMGLYVNRIDWESDNKGTYVIISLEESSYAIKQCHKARCPF